MQHMFHYCVSKSPDGMEMKHKELVHHFHSFQGRENSCLCAPIPTLKDMMSNGLFLRSKQCNQERDYMVGTSQHPLSYMSMDCMPYKWSQVGQSLDCKRDNHPRSYHKSNRRKHKRNKRFQES